MKHFIINSKNLVLTLVLIACFFIHCTGIANAKKVSIIRDAEIENTIRELATPVFKAANLDPNSVKIHLILDKSLNAFVAGGQRLFIHTGLITESTNASQIIGVIAHETGHIAGGHLARVNIALEKTTMTKALSVLMGATAIVAGQGKVGQMIFMAGDRIAQGNFFRYSQTQESAADQAALRFLDESKQSAKGLLSFMNLLGDQEALAWEQQDLYARTHPLTRNRISTISNHISKSPHSENITSDRLKNIYKRARAKLIGFVNPVSRTLVQYKPNDKSVESRYARAISYFKKPDMSKALPLINSLIDEYPEDPYYWELKGQMIFESGDAKGALSPYLKATSFLPQNPLIKQELARVQLALNDPTLLNDIIINLKAVLAIERQSSSAWRQLAIAYGRRGDKGNSSLALAEEALLLGRLEVARYHGGLAETIFPKGSREWIQAQDILTAARKK